MRNAPYKVKKVNKADVPTGIKKESEADTSCNTKNESKANSANAIRKESEVGTNHLEKESQADSLCEETEEELLHLVRKSVFYHIDIPDGAVNFIRSKYSEKSNSEKKSHR